MAENTNTYTKWADDWVEGGRKTVHVDPAALHDGGSSSNPQGNFISSESTVVLSGPPTVAGFDINKLIPIGLAESFQVTSNKQINQIFELGSRESYMIPGRTMTQLALSRVMFNGDSLLIALRAGTGDPAHEDDIAAIGASFSPTTEVDGTNAVMGFNLAASVFNKPFGLALASLDSEGNFATLSYFENCMVQTHQVAMQSQNLIILENVSIRCTGIKTIGAV